MTDVIEKFKKFTKRPAKFLEVQSDVAESVKCLVKDLYDYSKKVECVSQNTLVLPELIIEDFDDEQIWQQIELNNNFVCNNSLGNVSKLLASKNKLQFPLSYEENEVKSDIQKTKRKAEDEEEDDDGEEEEEEEIGSESENSTEDSEESQEETYQKKHNKTELIHYEPSVVDDKFFKLRQLEEFLDKEDKNEFQQNKRDEDSDDVESLDLFQDFPFEEEEDEENPYYNKFFDAPEDELNSSERRERNNEMLGGERKGSVLIDSQKMSDELDDMVEEEEESKTAEKRVRFNLSPAVSEHNESDLEDSEANESQKLNGLSKTGKKSDFEARQERLQARIKKFEEQALTEKPWQMKGEISATARPQNSLLEEVLEFDMTTRPAPVVTEQTTMRLEDIIRQRIKDKAWDDVERKIKPTLQPDEYKKRLVMDQEKSKLSLAEIYEQEYLKQKEIQDSLVNEKPEEEPPEHRVIRSMTTALFAKLDALTNYHYTPKHVIPEVKVVSNLPAIVMEEVAPTTTSDATLLAPEEIRRKEKGDVISKGERTKTDKKRERRKKKLMQRYREKEKEKREKLVQKLKPGLGNKYSKERALDTLKKLSNDKNVYELKDEGKDKGVRSSTAFFNQLQAEVTSHIKSRTGEENTNKQSKKMKLS